jgi:hypothetical protein
MRSQIATARFVGALFIVATVAAVMSNLFLNPLRNDSNYLARPLT